MLVAVGWRVCLGFIILALAGFAIAFLALDVNEIREGNEDARAAYSAVLQSFVYVLAILVGGALAVYKLRVFRDFEPHLTVSHVTTHRRIGSSYWHIAVTATMRNTSRVEVEIQKRIFRLQQISPISDDEVKELYTTVAREDDREKNYELEWHTLVENTRTWRKHEIIVEPGESDQETMDFIIGDGVRSILVHTYFYNPGFRPGTRAVQGWGATSVHDMLV